MLTGNVPAAMRDYIDAITAETAALADPTRPDTRTGLGRFTAIVDGMLADSADRSPDFRSAAVRTAASIFMYAGWAPEHVAVFAAAHIDEAVADAWPHDADCWCPICLIIAEATPPGALPDGTLDAVADILRRLADADIDGGYVMTPGPGTPHVTTPTGSAFLSDLFGDAPTIGADNPYTVGLTFTDGADERVVWQGVDYESAVDALIAVVRTARAVTGGQ
jgi:hypothetical protein